MKHFKNVCNMLYVLLILKKKQHSLKTFNTF